MAATPWVGITQVTPATGQVRKEQLTALLLPQLCKRKFQLFPIWVLWKIHMHRHNYIWKFSSQLWSSGSRRSVHKSQSSCFSLYHVRHIRMYTGINKLSLEASASAFCIIHLEFFNVLPLAIFLRLVCVHAFSSFRLCSAFRIPSISGYYASSLSVATYTKCGDKCLASYVSFVINSYESLDIYRKLESLH